MNAKTILILLIVIALFVTPYMLRNSFFGGDSYYYLNYVCHHNNFDRGFLEQNIMNVLPCDIASIKLILAFLLFLTVVIIAYTSELFFKDSGLFAGIIALGFSPALAFVIMKFENDAFAMPLIALAFYFYFKSTKEPFFSKHHLILTGLSLLFLALAFPIWNMTGFALFVFAVGNPIVLMLLIGFLVLNPQFLFDNFSYHLFPVDEMIPLIGLTTIGLLVFGIIKPFKVKELSVVTAMVFAQARYFAFIPFTWILSVVNLTWFVESKTKHKKVFTNILLLWALIGVCAIGLVMSFYAPNPEDISLAQESAHLALDNNVLLLNDWGFGWVIINEGYDTSFKASIPQPDYNNFTPPAYLFINKLASTSHQCENIKESPNFKLLLCKQ